MIIFQQNLSDKNIFDYLEQSFKGIFSIDGQFRLRSSYFILIIAFIINSIFITGIIYSSIQFFMQPTLTNGYLIWIILFLLSNFIVSFLESSFYAIVIPKNFSIPLTDITIKRWDVIYKNIDIYKDIELWKQYIGRYILYIIIYTLIIIIYIISILLISIFTKFGVYFIPIIIFTLPYMLYRFGIAWYIILYEDKNGFLGSWNYLGGKVWSTIKKFFFFNWIVGIGSQIPFYIGSMFFPIFSSKVENILETFAKNINNIKESIGGWEKIQGLDLSQLTQGIDLGNIYMYSFIAVIIFFFFIIKIGTLLQNAMNHTFGMNYFLDVKKLSLENNQK